jgi:hypothetical protein
LTVAAFERMFVRHRILEEVISEGWSTSNPLLRAKPGIHNEDKTLKRFAEENVTVWFKILREAPHFSRLSELSVKLLKKYIR